MTDDYRAASREQWSGAAAAWERNAEHVDGTAADATEWMLERAAVGPGQRVLELACGPAGVGLRAARAVAIGGRVLCTDFAQSMVDAAARRAAEAGLENIDFRVIDAEDMDLEDNAFDAVLCRFGYMLMADPARALAETLRVLRPGGHVALAVWDEPKANPWAWLVMRTVMDHLNAPPPEPGTPGMFTLAGPDRLRVLLEAAGFEGVLLERVNGVDRSESLDAWWERIGELAGGLAKMLAALPQADREAIRTRALEQAQRYVSDDGVAFPAAVRVAAGFKPAG